MELDKLRVSYMLRATQTIYEARSTVMSDSFAPVAGATIDREALQRELLDEMTSWSPRERGGAFRSWHRHSISLVHLNVLTVIEAEGPVSMSRLAEALDVADASATGIVDRMEKHGLVERRHGTDDRRVVLVHATEAGLKVFSDMASHRREMLSRVFAELTEEEMAALLVGMRAIHAARDRLFARAGPGSSDEATAVVEPGAPNA